MIEWPNFSTPVSEYCCYCISWQASEATYKLILSSDRKDGNLMMLPSDLVLLQDDKFKKFVGRILYVPFLTNLTHIVTDVYAADQNAFFKDFTTAFQKLLELGTSNLRSI